MIDENFIGFSTDDYADSDTAMIAVVGNTDNNQSGLVVGQKYYVNPDGSLTTTQTDAYAGIALSATKILIKG
jgi:hypothetical protein